MEAEKRILYVDDDDSMRDLLAIFLSRGGFHITTVDTTQYGLVLLKSHDYDLIITDLNMPEPSTSGIEFALEAKNIKNIPIILFTAASLTPTTGIANIDLVIQKSGRAGFDVLMKKLSDKIHELLTPASTPELPPAA